jgi:hypothetical protein
MEELNVRKRKYDNIKAIGIFMSIIGGFLLFAARVDPTPVIIIVMILVGGPGLIMTAYASKKIKEISNEFKSTYIKVEIERLLPGSQYYPTEGISMEEVRKSHIVKLYDKFKSEDLIIGEVRGVGFQFSDLHIQDVRGSGKNRHVVTTFQGRMYVFDFNKRFRSDLFLLQPGQYRPFSNFTKIKMESIQFNSEFKIYAGNEHEAFYILTPHFMEKLLQLDRLYMDKIGFGFIQNRLYIAVDSRTDSFDVLGAGDISNKDVEKAVKELETIIEFVEFLKLDNTIFLPVE